MIDKTLIAALLATTTLIPSIGLSADVVPPADAAKGAAETSPAKKPAAGKPNKSSKTSKATASKATSDKAAPDKPSAAPANPDSSSGVGKAVAAGAVGAAAVGLAATAAAKEGPVDYTKMTPAELTEYLIFDAKGFKLDQPTQEGKTARERMTQDELQKACSALHGKVIDPETAKRVQEMAIASRVYPEGGITLGDWKRGEALAKEGSGFRLGPKVDDNSKKFGGNCYACHQMDLKVPAHGTLGPSLTGLGKIRGNTPDTQKYVYEVIYNAHAYFPCTNMPRFGANGFLTQGQIADLVAYVLDPESPVNK